MSILTKDKLYQIARNAPHSKIDEMYDQILQTMQTYQINSTLRIAHFLAQVLHESGSFKYTEELASGSAYEYRSDLGNDTIGDGVKFKGRGLIQLTGKLNYIKYGNDIGQNFTSNPKPVSSSYSVDAAGWFWDKRNLNSLADNDDLIRITKRVNGGLNGLSSRREFLDRAKEILGDTTTPADKTQSQPDAVLTNNKLNQTSGSKSGKSAVPNDIVTNQETFKSKDITQKFDKKIELKDLDVISTGKDAFMIDAEYLGSIAPFIVFNGYTFNYKMIDTMVLTYEDKLPSLTFSIIDRNNEFTALTVPTNEDILYLYLKPHTKEFAPIYMQFEISRVVSDDNYYTFICIPKIPNLFTEVCKSYRLMSSTQLFTEIANELELGFSSNIDATQDSMTWINATNNYISFLQREIQFAYKNDDTFFTFYIDFFYNLTFVELNNQFGQYKKQASFSSFIHPGPIQEFITDDNVVMNGMLIFSNMNEFRGTSNYIYDYGIVNSAGEIKYQNGYDRYAQFYDSELKTMQSHKVSPSYENENSDYKKLRSDSGDPTKYKYNGVQITNQNSRNVHDNYKYAQIQNYQNIKEIEKMALRVKIDKANFHIYRYMSLPVAIYEYGYNNINKIQAGNGKQVADTKEYPMLLEQYSGHYVVKNIRFTYNNSDLYIKQELDLVRREWPQMIK